MELHRLERASYVELPRSMCSTQISYLTGTTSALLDVLQVDGLDLNQALRLLTALLVNTEVRSFPDLSAATGWSFLRIDSVLKILQVQQFVQVDFLRGLKNSVVRQVDPLLGETLDVL